MTPNCVRGRDYGKSFRASGVLSLAISTHRAAKYPGGLAAVIGALIESLRAIRTSLRGCYATGVAALAPRFIVTMEHWGAYSIMRFVPKFYRKGGAHYRHRIEGEIGPRLLRLTKALKSYRLFYRIDADRSITPLG